MNANDPAFPASGSSPATGINGLTKRDLLAALAMQPLISPNPAKGMTPDNPASVIAKAAYIMADAMIAESERKPHA